MQADNPLTTELLIFKLPTLLKQGNPVMTDKSARELRKSDRDALLVRPIHAATCTLSWRAVRRAIVRVGNVRAAAPARARIVAQSNKLRGGVQ